MEDAPFLPCQHSIFLHLLKLCALTTHPVGQNWWDNFLTLSGLFFDSKSNLIKEIPDIQIIDSYTRHAPLLNFIVNRTESTQLPP